MEDVNFVENIFFSPGQELGMSTEKKVLDAKKGWDKRGEDTTERMRQAKQFVKSGTKIVDAKD